MHSATLLNVKMKCNFSRQECDSLWQSLYYCHKPRFCLPGFEAEQCMLIQAPKSLTADNDTFLRDTQMNKHLSEHDIAFHGLGVHTRVWQPLERLTMSQPSPSGHVKNSIYPTWMVEIWEKDSICAEAQPGSRRKDNVNVGTKSRTPSVGQEISLGRRKPLRVSVSSLT